MTQDLRLKTLKNSVMKKVAIIILMYNGQKYLPALLGSIFKYEPDSVKQEIIVVDNDSIDKTVSWLKENYPQVIVLEQSKNLGFAGGNNIGIKYAIDKGFDYVMLLNQDTIVSEGYLDKLIEVIESDETIAAVQPKLMLYPLTELVNSMGNVIHYLGFGYTYGHKQVSFKFQISKFKINYCSGAACLMKVEVLKKIGLFNENLFIYHEDLDLGWRFRLMGYKNQVVPESIVYHRYEFFRSIQKYYYMERNRFIVMFQNYRCLTILLILPALLVMELGLFIFSFKNDWWLEKLKVYLYFLNPLNWLKIIKKRKVIQRVRVKNDREVVWDFSGKIEHQEVDSQLVKLINPFFNLYWQIVKRLIFW